MEIKANTSDFSKSFATEFNFCHLQQMAKDWKLANVFKFGRDIFQRFAKF